MIDAVNKDFTYAASFDLTSFYDSIDHHVLRHFLRELRIDEDLIQFLLSSLKTWTSNTWTTVSNIIYHEHGIPQGPLASGLLSEVVLKHIDDRGVRPGATIYLRYVDDIKMFAKTEETLKQRLVSLDLAAKEIGLFPQSAKINIRKVRNPYEEIKSISRPPEPSLMPVPNQGRMASRNLELGRQGTVNAEDQTRFKYLLGRANPNARINGRLIIILSKHPHLYSAICGYFAKYTKLPNKAAEALLQLLNAQEIYHAVNASILLATLENMREPARTRCTQYCRDRIFSPKRRSLPLQPSFKASLIAWLLKENRLTFVELERIVANGVDWWVIKDLIKYLRTDLYGPASCQRLLNQLIRHREAEPARVSALKLIDEDLRMDSSPKDANESARLLLCAAGRLRHIGQPESLVGRVLSYVLSIGLPQFRWAKLFGSKHKDAEHAAFTVKRYFESDINSCLVTLDSLCDLIWEALYLKCLPGKCYGNYGAMLKHPKLILILPNTAKGFTQLHDLRLQSVTSHPRNTKKGTATRRLKHKDFYKVRDVLQLAVKEIVTTMVD